MNEVISLSLGVTALAIVISLVVAVLIKGIVMALSLVEGPPQAMPVAARAPAAGSVPDEHIAAISAAITAVMGSNQILHIEDRSRGGVWTAEGRMMHHTSHAVSRRPKT